MRKISYIRTEFHAEEININNTLLAFVYDVPYLGACGVFPPFHILNQIFLDGGGDGGMSPGATWKPFKITKEEYDELINAVLSTPPEDLKELARFSDFQFEFDSEFNDIQEMNEWIVATCEKHRESYHQKLKKCDSNI